MYDLSVYDSEFYVNNSYEQQQMCGWLMPMLRSRFWFSSFADFGCGCGWYVKWAIDRGLTAFGIDGSPAALSDACTPAILNRDLRHAISVSEWDIVMCLEVAEHIEAEYADTFVCNLCAASSVVVMTAAPPGQGGLQHVNEQPKMYWDEAFRTHGYERSPKDEDFLLHGIETARLTGYYVTPWLAPNLMVFRRS